MSIIEILIIAFACLLISTFTLSAGLTIIQTMRQARKNDKLFTDKEDKSESL